MDIKRGVLCFFIAGIIFIFVFLTHSKTASADTRHRFENVIINFDLYDQMSQLPDQSHLTLSSPGGWPVGIDIAYLIAKKNFEIEISDFCISGCAEYLLPAAKSVQFSNNPIIAVHGNPKIWREVALSERPEVEQLCSKTVINAYNDFSKHFGVSEKFWKDQLDKLKVKNARFSIMQNGCPKVTVTYENRYWLMTTDQIERYFSIDSHGAVCADNVEACKLKVDQRWKEGTRVIIGDTSYVSKGDAVQE